MMSLLKTLVKLYHIRYGKGQNVKLEKTAVQVLHVVLVNQEGSHKSALKYTLCSA